MPRTKKNTDLADENIQLSHIHHDCLDIHVTPDNYFMPELV